MCPCCETVCYFFLLFIVLLIKNNSSFGWHLALKIWAPWICEILEDWVVSTGSEPEPSSSASGRRWRSEESRRDRCSVTSILLCHVISLQLNFQTSNYQIFIWVNTFFNKFQKLLKERKIVSGDTLAWVKMFVCFYFQILRCYTF